MSDSNDEHRPAGEAERAAHTAEQAADGLGKNIGGLIDDDDPNDSTREDVERAFGAASDVAGAAEDGAKAWSQTEGAVRAAREGNAAGVLNGVTGATGATAGHVAENLGAVGHITNDEGFRDAARVAGVVQTAANLVGGVARQVEGFIERAEDAANARSRHVEYEFHVEGADGWQLGEFELTEALNEPYELRLVVHHEDPDAEPRELLGVNAEVLLDRRDHNRRVCGIVARVEVSDVRGHRVTATLTVVPALWGLGQRTDSVIFQDKTVKEILEERLPLLLRSYGREVDFGGLERDYPRREYCVQYRESDLSFCRRLMEEEGIGYYFDFEGEGWERMVLFERNGQLAEAPTLDGHAIPFVTRAEVVQRAEPIVRMAPARQLTATAVTVRDYDWTQGQTRVEASVEGEDAQGRARRVYDHGHGRTVSLFDFQEAGRYAQNDVDRQGEIRREALVRDAERFTGMSMVTGFAPGRTFEVQGHPVPGVDGAYLLTRVAHRNAALPGVEGSGGAEEYYNEFECLPLDVPWRPSRRADKPAIYGVQTAVVTGGNEGEIHTDHYSRIQVLFHWDREGGTERSSCWIRVAQVWAGHDGMGYPGFVFIPRVGMEVVVTFMDGDPDRPLVTGAVYNGTNLPPEALPDEASRSMIRTRSLGGTGYNELSFEDAAGSEEVHLRAERNLRELVQNNHTTHVHVNQSNRVGGNQEIHVEGEHRRVDVDHEERHWVGGSRYVTVDEQHEVTVHGAQSVQVDQNEDHRVHGHRTLRVDQGREETVRGGSTLTVAGGVTQTIQDGGWSMTTTGNVNHNVTGGMIVDTTDGITMTAGAGVSIAAQQAADVTAQQITLTSRTKVVVNAPGGITGLTPSTKTDVNLTSNHTSQNILEQAHAKIAAYSLAMTIYGVKADVCGVKSDEQAVKIEKGGFKAGSIAINLENGMTKISRGFQLIG